MKTSEFIKQVNALGYTTRIGALNRLLYILNGDRYIAVISLIEQYNFDLDFCTKEEMYDLYSLIGVYIRTPINDREEPKKYRLKHKYLNQYIDDSGELQQENSNYLSLDMHGFYLSSDLNKTDNDVQTEFTQEEIDEFSFKLDDWEREEV